MSRQMVFYGASDDCREIGGEFIEALSDWCEIHADEPVTARGIDMMLGIERARR